MLYPENEYFHFVWETCSAAWKVQDETQEVTWRFRLREDFRSMYPSFPAVRYQLQEGTSEKQRIDVPYETEKAEE